MGGLESHSGITYNAPLPNTQEKGFSAIYRNPYSLNELKTTPDSRLTSMKDVIYASLSRNRNRELLGRIKVTAVPTADGKTIDER